MRRKTPEGAITCGQLIDALCVLHVHRVTPIEVVNTSNDKGVYEVLSVKKINYAGAGPGRPLWGIQMTIKRVDKPRRSADA